MIKIHPLARDRWNIYIYAYHMMDAEDMALYDVWASHVSEREWPEELPLERRVALRQLQKNLGNPNALSREHVKALKMLRCL